jgi:hypothetical protein
MKSALALVLGVSVLALAAGCDPASTEDPGTGTGGKIAVGGTTGTTAGTGTTGGSGAAAPTDGVAITPVDGWVDVESNALGIQGAIFSYGDNTSKTGMTENFTGANACIKGTAAEVMDPCTIVAPATDCYGTFWGAAIGLNLNQPKDPATGMGVEMALPFNGSALKGFRFTMSGGTVPTTLRFKVEDGTKEYCTSKTVGAGTNTVLFSELTTECWKSGGTTAEGIKSSIVKIAWQTVTKKGATIPFDYCVSDIVALTTGAPPTGPVGGTAGSSSTGTAGTASGGSASGGTASGGSGSGGTASGGTTSGGTASSASGTGGAIAGSGGSGGGTGGASGGSGGSGGG